MARYDSNALQSMKQRPFMLFRTLKEKVMLGKLTVVVSILLLTASFSSAAAQNGAIVDVAAAHADFSTLVSLVQAAGLADVLSSAGPFTVFAPTDDAFAALPQPVVEYLQGNPGLLTQVLSYHVVDGAIRSADAATGAAATLDSGHSVDIVAGDAAVRVNNASVIAADIEASNGVIHMIDTVLIPNYPAGS
jgi:transforming growth factor-beta-induced protein